jgi:Ala-tRNA(Pro) deacylase
MARTRCNSHFGCQRGPGAMTSLAGRRFPCARVRGRLRKTSGEDRGGGGGSSSRARRRGDVAGCSAVQKPSVAVVGYLSLAPVVSRALLDGKETMSVFDRLVFLFTNENARFRIIEHTPEGRSDLVAGLRGTTIAQGAKAIVCAIPVEGREQYVLAVLPGDRRVDMKAVARIVGGRKGSFAQTSLAEELTGCVVGAIPPVVFNGLLKLVVDKEFLERESEIAFNAGRLDRSIVISSADYARIVCPTAASIVLS